MWHSKLPYIKLDITRDSKHAAYVTSEHTCNALILSASVGWKYSVPDAIDAGWPRMACSRADASAAQTSVSRRKSATCMHALLLLEHIQLTPVNPNGSVRRNLIELGECCTVKGTS